MHNNYTKTKRVKLVLKDGSIFYGFSFGGKKSVSGEVVFNTGMVGYPESMTDASYHGQILVMAYPLIGNYGVPPLDKEGEVLKFFESDKIHVNGLVISDYSFEYSHWNAASSLSGWMSSQGIPGIYGIDTRELIKKLRENGTMMGKIIVDKDVEIRDINKLNLVSQVSIKKPVQYGDETSKVRIILVDCGVKFGIIRSFLKRGVYVIRVPWDFDFNNCDYKFDAVFVSNGPGNPEMCNETIKNLKKAMEKKNPYPIMGICLGNQLIGLAAGGETYKLKYGHRSQNQPCINTETKKCYITSQNHGYALVNDSLASEWDIWFINANDGTNEGIKHKTKPFMATQFHLEHSPGPRDAESIFDEFIETIKKNKTK